VITEEMLRAPAAVKKDDGKKDEKQASGGGGHGGAQAAAGGHGESVSGEIVTYINKLDKFTVNLAGEPKRSIRIEVNLELLNEKSYEESLDVGNLPRIRDRIVSVLNDKTFSDIESIQGKLFLKERIATEVNSILDEGVVKDVYFSEMVVQ
jgi:flagellar FliL protein